MQPSSPQSGNLYPELATTAQIERERLAIRVFERPEMRDAVEQIKALYAAHPLGATATGQATMHRAASATAFMSVYHAVLEPLTADPAFLWFESAPHCWHDMEVPRAAYGIDNPQAVYRHVILDVNSKYVITGKVQRPGPVQLHFEARSEIPGVGPTIDPEGSPQTATLNGEDMVFADDGSFLVTLDTEPANGRINHMQVPPVGYVFLVTRDLLTDWTTQNIYSIEITRTDGPPAQPMPSDEALAQRAAEIALAEGRFWIAFFDKYTFVGPVNSAHAIARPGGRGLAGGGHFKLADDEALVVTVEPLSALAVDIQITDPWGVQFEYLEHLSCYNLAESKPNPDGSYTYVISRLDPGVHNWLEPQGHDSGMIALRWQALTGPADPKVALRPTEMVKLADLKSALAPNTVFVDPEQREIQRAERVRAYLRHRPPQPAGAD